MGLFAQALSIFGFEQKSTQTATYRPELTWAELESSLRAAQSGEVVTRESALMVTAVLAACRVNAEAIAMLPLTIRQDNEEQRAHPLFDLLQFEPNPFQPAFMFKEMLQYHLELYWDAFIWIIRTSDGRVQELYPLPPEWVEVTRNRDWSINYDVTLNVSAHQADSRVRIPAEDIIHISGASWDGIEGMDAIRNVRNAIGLSLAAERHASGMFKNGAVVSGVLQTDKELSEAVIARLKKQWADNYAGSGNAYKTPVLEQGLKFEAVSMTAIDSQLIEARKFQIEEVARWSKTPAPLLGAGEKLQAYASVEQMMLFWLQHGIVPRCSRWESALMRRLTTKEDRARGLRIEFDKHELLRGDLTAQSNYYSKALGSGGSPPWMVVNEARARMGLAPRKEPWANELARGTNPTAGNENVTPSI